MRLPLQLIPKASIVRIKSGIGRGLRWTVGAGPHGYWLGTYERDVQKQFTKLLQAGDHFLDVGANAGFYTLLAARLVGKDGRVSSFEPLPRNLSFLRQHVSLNNLQNVTVHAAAVSDQDGVARFNTHQHASMGNLTEQGALEVKTVALDSLFAAGQLRPAKLIKIDVEGAEHSVLLGARNYLLSCHPVILLSGHGTAVQLKCEALLGELGYDVHVERDGTVDGMYESICRFKSA